MGLIEGVGDCELEEIVQTLQSGGSKSVTDGSGHEVVVRVMRFDPSHAVDPYAAR